MAFEADYRLSPGATLNVWPELSVSPDAFSGPCQILCLYFVNTKKNKFWLIFERSYLSLKDSDTVFKIGFVRYLKTVFSPVLISAVRVIPG